jgi:hypothetical protein
MKRLWHIPTGKRKELARGNSLGLNHGKNQKSPYRIPD